MRFLSRTLVLSVALLAAGAVAPAAALASCVQQSVSEQAAAAEVVVVGVVTQTRQTFVAASGVIRFRPERVLKGTLTKEIQVYLGPTHGGAPSSVDYTAVINGERHTLYLRATTDGSYETSSCAGSHQGAQTADEEKILGTGTLVAAASDATMSPLLIAALAAIMSLAAIAIVLGVRRARRGA
jgi:hypothetical protein